LQNNKSSLSIRRCCDLLNVNRSNLYYKATKDTKNQDLCSLILDIWLEHNNKGWRTIQADLQEYHSVKVNHKKLRRLMHKLGIRGILPKKTTSKSNPQHYKYPYVLKNMEIYRANLAWCSDITYIKLPQGHVYLVAIVDIYSRMILDYEISNTLDAELCIRCLERCIKKYGTPVVFNTDQGVQYTCSAWINALKQHDIIISMDGKGRWADNIWIERMWRTIKYECVNLFGVENLLQLRLILNNYISYYNNKRLHSSLGYKQPTEYYEESLRINKNSEYVVYCKIDKNIAVPKKVA
jgi:putative transposase